MSNPADVALEDGYAPDSKVAQFLGKHPKTLPRWDKNPKLKALGWPDAVYLNGRRHRPWPGVREFLRNAAQAHITQPLKP